MTVLLATCEEFPDGEPGGDLLVTALAARGLDARWARWDDPTVDWDGAELVAVRSTWDYQRRLPEFLAWAGALRAPLLNGAEVFAWNTDKSYLLDLVEAGLPVVPTVVAHDADEVRAAVERFGDTVAKPTVGASGVGVVVLRPGEDVVLDEGPWVVQPLVESVRTEGEHSVYVLGGEVSCQVGKQPAQDGSILVHEEYGGRSDAVRVDEECAGLALEAVRVAEELRGVRLDYARVDQMRLADGRLAVSELELVEPGLYLDVVPENADAFAAMVARTRAAS
jgi:glutathione synthase/RimK-type ligase-like ATP-grasp enzyme